ncbi:MAG: Gfo/Idh/MocA family oxidoreductase [Spirochaetales bacterium]|nr:Gfo/Idh/MocA family oxidoreductase [Spirochaetales bacterium]
MDKLKIAFIGTGWISDWYHKALSRCNTFEIVGAAGNPSPEGREHHRKKCNAWNIKAYTSMEQILQDQEVDAVAILSPTHLHYEQTMAALGAGKHVLVEKPVSLSREEIDILEAESKKTGLLIFPGHNFVYRPVIWRAKSIIKSGKLGVISYASFRSVKLLDKSISEGWRKSRKLAGGGAMMDSGTHLVYQSLFLLGKPQKLSSFIARKHCTQMDCEDICQISVCYPDGLIGQITQSWASADSESSEIRIQGDKGSIVISDSLYLNGKEIEKDASYGDSFYHTICAFAEAIKSSVDPLSTLADAGTTLEIVYKAYESAEKGKVIVL